MRFSRIAKPCLLTMALSSFSLAAHAATIKLQVEDVQSARGQIIASLCDDPAKPFPGGCLTYSARAAAQQGTTTLLFNDVKPGRYAIQVVHDENGNGRPDIPQEAFAFGNDVPYPPAFDAAAITVTGDMTAHVRLVHMLSNGANPVETHGAAPPDGVTRSDVRANGLYGELYVPAHDRPLPLLIAIGGSEGGLDIMSSYAAGFAKHGYAVLALAWWKAPGLPQTLENIPLEYFDHAVAWAKARPEIAPDRIVMLGWSRGAEAALLTASRNSDIHAVIGVSPTAFVWLGLNFANPAASKPAWTVTGKPLPFNVPGTLRPGENFTQAFTAALASADAKPEAIIPVEKINGPVLLLSGSDDRLWPSGPMAARIVARLKTQNFSFRVEHQNYPGAGHAVFVGDPASAPRADTASVDAFMGGSAGANDAARADSWLRVMRFLDVALKR